ncbi:MAG: Ltp family lipoprotein [Limnobacter sp.]|jgi:hypothetical protein
MDVILFLLAIAFFIMLLWGIVKPTKAFLGSDSTRSKVGKVYGLGFIALLICFIVAVPKSAKVETASTVESDKEKPSQVATAPTVLAPTPSQAISVPSQPAAEELKSLTGPQNNAVRSAKQYLSISGFSRQGLIEQLSSDAGDGYMVADATVAVDSLNIDWNEQAVRSAKQYLSISGFSCKGLIEQLSSSAGDGYTKNQATYGAEKAGAC